MIMKPQWVDCCLLPALVATSRLCQTVVRSRLDLTRTPFHPYLANIFTPKYKNIFDALCRKKSAPLVFDSSYAPVLIPQA
jgi:hypothetical protein